MSLAKVNLAPILRQAQQKSSPEAVVYCKNMLDELSRLLELNGLSTYFSAPLSKDEILFLKTFLDVLKNNIKTIENIVPIYFQCFLNLDIERAKQITFTFGIHLVESHSGLLYLSWSKGVFDEM